LKITEYIKDKIERLPKGYIFTYNDFIQDVNNKEAVIKGLNRMAATGKISKLSKGKYYKPENTVFGELQLNQYQIVKDLLEYKGKLIGYLTGYSVYNQLGLSSQVSNIIQIGKNETRPTLKRSNYTIAFVKQKNTITKNNIPLLQILDSIRYIKKIPGTTIIMSCKRFMAIISDLSEKEKNIMVRLAQKYSPATRALLGALLEEIGNKSYSAIIQKSLNPITKYNFSGVSQMLSNAQKWNIK